MSYAREPQISRPRYRSSASCGRLRSGSSMRFRKQKTWHRSARGLVSLSILLSICAMTFPLPMSPNPAKLDGNTDGKDKSQPFPCEDRPCGCQTASQCWRKCCCFTNTQKLAWAKSRGVSVPEYVKAAAPKEFETDRELCSQPKQNEGPTLTADQSAGLSRATKSSRSPTCRYCGSAGSGNKCALTTPAQSSEHRVAQRTALKASDRKSQSTRWVLAISASACHGQGPFSFALITALIPESPLISVADTIPTDPCIPVSERLESAALRPPLPPPKIG
jgi:hypothetical protein